MKRFLRVICSAVLTLCVCTAVFSAEAESVEPGTLVMPEPMIGEIVGESDGQITVQNAYDENDRIVLNISPETVVVDAVTGMSAALESRDGELVKVYYGPIETRSMPPVSNAVIIAINRKDGVFSPNYTVAEKVTRVENGIEVLADNGSIVISVDNETPLMPYLTRNIVTLEQIAEGTRMLMWYEIAALSMPAQATAQRVVVLGPSKAAPGSPAPESAAPAPESPAPESPAPAALPEDILINPVTPVAPVAVLPADALASPITREPFLSAQQFNVNGVTMFSVREICEAYGYTVTWDAAAKHAVVSDGAMEVMIMAGIGEYSVDGFLVETRSAPVMKDNKMLASVDFFEGFPRL